MARASLGGTFLAAGLFLALAACSQAPRLDASNYQALNASFNQARAHLSPRDHVRFDQARKRFNAAYFSNGRETTTEEGRAPWRVVDGMDAEQFLTFAHTLERPSVSPQEPTFPDPALATRLLRQYRVELELLEQARDRAHDKGQNTIDQFPLLEVAYIPPMNDVPIELDRAEFVITIRNDSGFDAYNPEVRIRVLKPGDDIPALDRIFKYENKRDPLGAGDQLTMRFECCALAIDPLHNALLKGLTQDSSIDVDLLQVTNFNNAPLLDRRAFAPASAQRMKVLALCIERISTAPATWVPYAEADQPGGCGDPDQSDNLLSMWQSKGVQVPREYRHLLLAPAAPAGTQQTSPAPSTPANRPHTTGSTIPLDQPSTPVDRPHTTRSPTSLYQPSTPVARPHTTGNSTQVAQTVAVISLGSPGAFGYDAVW